MHRTLRISIFAALAMATIPGMTAEMPAGFLCCNMRSDGSKIIDINYEGPKQHIIPVGTPVKVLGLGHERVDVTINGRSQIIKNEYSRDLSIEQFAKRYVVAEDPSIIIANFPERTRDAIASARLIKGMTRAQVIMSVGYPVTSENHNIDNVIWKFWLESFAEFDVVFDSDNRLLEVDAIAETKAKVFMQ
jgi:hypothetical protein